MSEARELPGPVKAWIEPDRWAYVRAFPLYALLSFLGVTGSVVLALVVHPGFWVIATFAMFRQASAESVLRELWREGMLHPGQVLREGRLATLVRLEGEKGVQDAIVISRVPRRWQGAHPPWGGERAAMVIAGEPPRLRPLSADLAMGDNLRAKRAAERIPEVQWDALSRGLSQLTQPLTEGVHPVELGERPWYGTLHDVEIGGSLPEYLSDTRPTVFCAGLPCVEEPELAPRERERVRNLRRRSQRFVGLFIALALLPPVMLAFFLQRFYGRTEGVMPNLIATAGALSLLAAPLLLFFAASSWRKARAYGRDLAEGKLLRFLGQISSFDSLSLDPDLAMLARRGVVNPEPGQEQDILVLRHALEPLHANGHWVKPGLSVRVEHVAVPPEEPFKMPLPKEVRADVNEAVDVARRRLTELEAAELLRHSAALKRPGRIFWILTAIAVLAVSSWHGQGWVFPPKPISLVLALLAWVFAAFATFKRSRLSGLLAEDAALGWVVTVDSAIHHDDDTELPARGVETLLHARMDWTVNRRPATWRRYASRTEGPV